MNKSILLTIIICFTLSVPLKGQQHSMDLRYTKDHKEVYYEDEIIKGADTESFVVLSKYYAKDKERVYYEENVIVRADPESFHILAPSVYYGKDKSNVFYRGKTIEGVDFNSFEPIDESFARDKGRVYYLGNVVENADPESFRVLTPHSIYGYSKDKNNIYFNTILHRCTAMEDAHLNSFEVIALHFAKDKDHVYYDDNVIVNADPDSFHVLNWDDFFSKDRNNVYFGRKPVSSIDITTFEVLGAYYGKDKEHVYYEGDVIAGADPKSFSVFAESKQYGKDNKNVYYQKEIFQEVVDVESFVLIDVLAFAAKDKYKVYSLLYPKKILEEADPETFKFINYTYAKDKTNVYNFLYSRIVKKADPETFKNINVLYSKDRYRVFYDDVEIEGADPESFEIMEDGIIESPWNVEAEISEVMKDKYSRDKNKVYLRGKPLEGVDSGACEIIHPYYVRDAKSVYFTHSLSFSGNGIIQDADSESFKVLGEKYGKDKNNVYWERSVIKEADVNSFEVVSDEYKYAKDKNNVYQGDFILDGISPDSFEALNRFYIKNSKYVYFMYYDGYEILQDADPGTFEALSDSYGRDKDKVYYSQHLLKGADPESFEVIGKRRYSLENYAKDKNNVYEGFTILKNVDVNTYRID